MLTSTVLTQLAVPALVARLGVGRTLALGLLALGAPAPLHVLSADLIPMLAIAVVRGAGFAVLTVVGATLAATVVPAERRGEAIGLYGLAVSLPNLVGIPAGVALTQVGEFRWVAWLAAAPVLAIPVALSLQQAMTDGAVPPGATDAPMPAGKPVVRAVLIPSLILLVVTLAGGGLVTFLPIERPTGSLAAVALALFGASAALTRWRVGALADVRGDRVLLPAAVLSAAAGMGMLSVGLQGRLSSDALVLVGATLFGAGYGSVQNLTLVIAFARAGPRRTTTASAIWNAAFDAGTGVGAVAVGAVAAIGLGLPGSFGVTAVLVALSLPLAVRVRRPKPTPRAQ